MEITKGIWKEFGFDYTSYIATGQYYECASKIFRNDKYLYKIAFIAQSPGEWKLEITYNMHMNEDVRRTYCISLISMTTLYQIKKAWEFITQADFDTDLTALNT